MRKRQQADKHNYERWLRLNASPEQRAEIRHKSRRVMLTGFGATGIRLTTALGRM